MANPEHVAILKQGVEAWNRWREEEPKVRPDLASADLYSSSVAYADLAETSAGLTPFSELDRSGAFLGEASGDSYEAARRGIVVDELDRGEANASTEYLELGEESGRAYLQRANFSSTDLRRADFRQLDLGMTNFVEADLRGACLAGVDLHGAKLTRANLQRASLRGASLRRVDLRGTTLIDAELVEAMFLDANLQGSNLAGAFLVDTGLGRLDLRDTEGCDEVRHLGPSLLTTGTLRLSQGQIPERFLKGCGLQDWEIVAARLYDPGLRPNEIVDIQNKVFRLRAEQPIAIGSLFISYSHANAHFVEAVDKRLDEKGIRFWRDVHDLRAGRIEKQIDRGIRLNPTVLLVLSEDSVESDWVRWEASKARELEKELGRDVLCPVALDGSWKECRWPGHLRQQIEDYHILDFSDWEDEGAMDRQLAKLLEGLALFYERGEG